MANVFTKKTKIPRSTTLFDYRGHNVTETGITLPRILSPTRRANPHPGGLKFQIICHGKAACNIWNPDFNTITKRMPKQLNHIRWVNFSSGLSVEYARGPGIYVHPTAKVICGRERLGKKEKPEKVPRMQYTTTSGVSYRNPCMFPELKANKGGTRYQHTHSGGPVKGIVPNLTLADYKP